MRRHRAEWTELVQGKQETKKKPKYRNEKSDQYDSKKEAKRAQELRYLQHIGEISNLEEKPKYELIPKQVGERAVTYTGDFRYEENGKIVVEDVKSSATKTQQYRIRRKLMLWIHGIKIRET